MQTSACVSNSLAQKCECGIAKESPAGSQLLIRLIKPDFDIIKVVNSFASRCLVIPAIILISKVTLRQLYSQVAQDQK